MFLVSPLAADLFLRVYRLHLGLSFVYLVLERSEGPAYSCRRGSNIQSSHYCPQSLTGRTPECTCSVAVLPCIHTDSTFEDSKGGAGPDCLA